MAINDAGNNMTAAQKAEIDKMDYEQMLRKWRFTPVGDKMFDGGEVSLYFKNEMFRKKRLIGDDEAVKISKRIGWGKQPTNHG